MDLPDRLKSYVERFNRDDEETIINEIPNSGACEWMLERVPLVAVPDEAIERIYYFRWWTYRKHIRKTPEGHILSEFNVNLPIPWSKKYGAISCAAGHHVDEGGWLRENAFLDEYIRFWYDGDNRSLHSYGNWLEAAVAQLCRRRGDWTLGIELLDRMIDSYSYMESTQMHASGLYFSIDDRDGQEYSVGGSGLRPTVNSYMYAGATGIAEIAHAAGRDALARKFEDKACALAERVNALLWDEEGRFYKTLPLRSSSSPLPASRDRSAVAREIIGYMPWRFSMAPEGRADAFSQLLDPGGFGSPVAPPVCERRHPGYVIADTAEKFNNWLRMFDEAPYPSLEGPERDFAARKARGDWLYLPNYHLHACQYNGPSWAYSTACMLGAAANLLIDYAPCDVFTKADYVRLLSRYAASHRLVKPDGREVCWIDEAQDPDTGEWITRKIYYERKKAHPEATFRMGIDRGKDYNHSTFCDLVLSGLFGVRPTAKTLRVVPLFPESWPYARLQDVRTHGTMLTVDYQKGRSYDLYIDGELAFTSAVPAPAELKLA